LKNELKRYGVFQKRMDIDLRRLKFFIEVVRRGGFSHAALVMCTTQSTVSKAIRQLEDELGVPLLKRIGPRSVLTAAGEIVYRRALSLLTECGDLIAELDELRGLERGKLRVGFPRLGVSSLFAPLFASFRRRYPRVEVELVVLGRKRLEACLLAGEIDLAVLVHPISLNFEWQDDRIERLAVLLPKKHAMAEPGTVSLKTLAEFPFILLEEGAVFNDAILDACGKRGFTPEIAARSSQVDFIFELVASGVGIGFLPRTLVDNRPHRAVQFRLLDDPECEWRMAMAWRRGGYLSHAARAWLEHAGEKNLRRGRSSNERAVLK
jgi:DNA-binding transcriptional LysR family regulator